MKRHNLIFNMVKDYGDTDISIQNFTFGRGIVEAKLKDNKTTWLLFSNAY